MIEKDKKGQNSEGKTAKKAKKNLKTEKYFFQTLNTPELSTFFDSVIAGVNRKKRGA